MTAALPFLETEMTAHRHRLPLVLIATTAMALAGCAPKAPAQLPPEPGAAVAPGPEANPVLQGPAPGSAADFLAFIMGQDTIHFDYDKYDVQPGDAPVLQRQAQWLMRYPAKHATIEGHCDERGTRDYNLALGEKRANAAKNYLVSLGVDPSRLSTISYGKERPVDPASNDAAWARNRRAVTVAID